MSADAADAAHLAQDGQRVRHDAHHIGRIHDVERLVGKRQSCRILLKSWMLCRPSMFRAASRNIGSDTSIPVTRQSLRIERSRKAGADPDLENLVPWLQRELMHRLAPARLQDRTTQPVIDRRTLCVELLDEITVEGCHRQRVIGTTRAPAAWLSCCARRTPSAHRLRRVAG